MPAYLDHAATAPLRECAATAFLAAARTLGNASSIHAPGRSARRIVEEARESVAADLGAEPAEVILTSGGTEADNLAVLGAWHASPHAGVAVSAIEHPAVLESAHALGRAGARVHVLPVDADGVTDVEALRAAEDLAIVSVMWANNETGTIQPLDAVVAAAGGAPVHSDAVQAIAHVPVRFAGSGLAALSVSGHKIGAPVGIGALVARRGLPLGPHTHGGLQERGVRSGSVNAAGAAALAAALREVVTGREAEAARLAALRDRLQDGLVALGARVWGAGADRLPGHLLVTVPGTRSEAVLFGLDMAGVAASAGSACQAGVVGASPVVLALGGDEEEARAALRFTLGHTSTAADVDAALAALPAALDAARSARKVTS